MPIHYDGYEIPGVYEPVTDPLEALAATDAALFVPEIGEAIWV